MTRLKLLEDYLLDTDGRPIYVLGHHDLEGPGGNVFAVVVACERTLKLAGVPKLVRTELRTEMLSGDYVHALDIAERFVGARFAGRSS